MSGSLISQREEQPVLVLTCQRDSHPFQDRTIILNDVVKVGRSVARAKPAKNNAIFDCKVLSRSHALIWHKAGRFWLRDTNSSNGTFVNNTRMVKKNDEEFPDREIFSGDVIRFGVDVVEHDTTHGCIIAQVALYYPGGVEAKQNVDSVTSNNVMIGAETLHTEQMFRLTHYISEALFREQILDTKLESIKRLLQVAQEVSESGWQAMVDEERLLEKLSLYETQLSLLKKDLPENSLQSHLMQALEEKFNLEKASKMMLERLLNEKAEVFSKATDLEHSLVVSQKECIRLRQDYENIQEAYRNLANERQSKLALSEESNMQIKEGKVEKSDVKVETEQQKNERDLEKLFDQFGYLVHKASNKQTVDGHNGGDANILVNGLDNGVSEIPGNYDDKLSNNIDHRFGTQNNFDLLKSSEPDNLCETQGQFTSTNDESRDGLISTRIIEDIQLFSQSNQLIKLLQNELSVLAKVKILDESTPSIPVNSGPLMDKIGSFESVDTSIDFSKTPIERLNSVNCKESDFENALQRATEYAALVANLQTRVGADLNSLCLLPRRHNNTDIFSTINDFCVPPDEFRTTHVAKMDVSLGTESPFDHIQHTEVEGTANKKAEINHLEASVSHNKLHRDEELSKLQDELSKSVNEIEIYKQLTDDLRKQDSAKGELLSLVREECDALKNRIAIIESDVATSRADHHRLISEARRAQSEADELLVERDNLSKQLTTANSQIEHLQKLLATSLLGETKSSLDFNKVVIPNETSNPNSLLSNRFAPDQCPKTSNTPLHEHYFSLFAVIPVMALICAFMVYIFLKFVR
ncbi:Sarcolemmal membrane-associated protein [Schistosoma japonicum]|uniref:Sarcolemmal membrane-associated protein n=1 Tax=Schistosoma japonicum TaxID=6182 RepID=A0A4Z2DM10_SCHJA|nr:Sarcolemmal membrane-associated protein [Schistosoma japonicum]